MLITILILLLISNAATTTQNKSILYSRITIQGLLLTIYIAYHNLYLNAIEKGVGIYGGLFNVNLLTQSFNILIMLLTVIIMILTAFYPRKLYNLDITSSKSFVVKKSLLQISNLVLNKNTNQFNIIEYALIILFILTGAVFFMSTGDLISLFLSIELQSYGLYILATLYRNSESATSSGLTYFLLGGLSSCFILLGSAVLYVNSGTTNLDNIYIINSINDLNVAYIFSQFSMNYINFSLIILAVGFLFKISASPFHFWSPDVYDGIPTVVTTFVAIIAKISIFVVMLELVSYTDPEKWYTFLCNAKYSSLSESINTYEWKNTLLISSLMSLIIGSVLGLTQHRIKRLFAYSTISHVGFILLALCVNKIESIQGYMFYIIQYSMSNLNAFIIILAVGYTLYDYFYSISNNSELKLIDAKNSPIQLLSQLKGYFHINSFLAISFAITLFSFVGIPPLIGFFAKQMVLSAALDQGYVFMTLIGIITSVIGAVYYLNIVKLIFFSESDYVKSNLTNKIINNKYNNIITINDGVTISISIMTMLISLFIFIPGEWFRIVSILSLPIK